MFAADNWRRLRGRLILSGIPNPLRQLPDMHAVLDVAEAMITEHMTGEQQDDYFRRMYPESRTRLGEVDENGMVITPPPGFDAEDELAAFDAFAKMAGG